MINETKKIAKQFTQENHYVPQGYLRRWVTADNKVSFGRLLVPKPEMPVWDRASIRGLGKHRNLYTRVVAGAESDEIEHWLNFEFETPAQTSIEKAISGDRLSSDDWQRIIRFLAAQDVRTPARMFECMKRWDTSLQSMIQETTEGAVNKLVEAQRTGKTLDVPKNPYSDYLPIKVSKDFLPEAENGTLRVEMISGRGLWLFSLRHLLGETWKVLLKHKWTILLCPDGMQWMTTDDPVVKMNYQDESNYNFGGGWASNGTEIFMPLGPRHLLYTRVGKRGPVRGTVLRPEVAQQIQQKIVGHAHRFVFAIDCNTDFQKWRPRHISLADYISERDQWGRWADDNANAERNLLTKSG